MRVSMLIGSALAVSVMAPCADAQHILAPRFGAKFDPTFQRLGHHNKIRAPIVCGETCFGYTPTRWATGIPRSCEVAQNLS